VDFAEGGGGVGGDFDKIQARFSGLSQGFSGGGRTDLGTGFINQEDWRDPDLLVVAEIRRNGTSS
jgi:hypothetical protein